MSSDNTTPARGPLDKWAYGIITVYAVFGYFAGKEHSGLAGMVLLAAGSALGWWLAGKLTAASPMAKGGALAAPFAALLLSALLTRTPAAGRRATGRDLNGTWVSGGMSKKFTLRLQGGAAWLSAESGVQNAAYTATIQNDSLVLRGKADEDAAPLRWGIGHDTTRNRLVLLPGGGTYFLKVEPQ